MTTDHAPAQLFGASHPGKERNNNEDSFGIHPRLGLCVIADGMGGLSRGEVASRRTVEAVIEGVKEGLDLTAAFRQAHHRVRDEVRGPANQQVGSTAVALALHGMTAEVCWLGDSRAYLWRGGALSQITKDHSLVQEMLDVGAISADEAAAHPYRNVVTRAIGIRDLEEVAPSMEKVELAPGDRVLLCTDGLTGYLTDDAIREALAAGGSSEEIVQRLIDRTLAETKAGDNITVICATLDSATA